MSCMCRNMEKAGWLGLWKGRLGCLGKWQWPMEGLVVKEGCFLSSRIQGEKRLFGRGRADGAMRQGSRLPAPLFMSRPLQAYLSCR